MLTKIQDIICETQGDIFRCASQWKLDMDIFVPKYMDSQFCLRNMDGIYSYFQMADGEECLDYILKEIDVPTLSKEKYQPQIMEWVGFTYRQLAFVLAKKSSEILDKLPLTAMLMYYPGLHTVDEEMAIDIICEDTF